MSKERDYFKEVKQNVDILEFVKTLTGAEPKPAGNQTYELKRCPFCGHRDCFRMFTDTQMFKCFSCEAKGDVYSFVEKHQSLLDKYKQLEFVAAKIGYQLPKQPNMQLYNGLKDSIKDYDLIQYIYTKAIDAPQKHFETIIKYLTEERLISMEIVKKLIENKKVGYNYFNDTEYILFACHNMNGHLTMINNRSISGNRKMMNKGALDGSFFYLDKHDLIRAKTVYITEGIINALTIMSLGMDKDNGNTDKMKKHIAIALISSKNTDIDFSFLKGKRIFLVKDNDDAGEQFTTKLYWKLIDYGIKAFIVNIKNHDHNDMLAFGKLNDINDVAQEEGYLGVKAQLENIERRVIWQTNIFRKLTTLEWSINQSFVVQDLITEYKEFEKEKTRDLDNREKTELKETGKKSVCNFKIWKIETYRILDLMTNEPVDSVYRIIYSSANKDFSTATFSEGELKNEKSWGKIGVIFSPQLFKQYINLLLHRSDDIKEIKNIVGLNYINNTPVICDAGNTAFDEENMSPYQSFKFPAGDLSTARMVFDVYKNLLTDNKALVIMNWILGSFHKAQLGFYPHLSIDAGPTAGKSTMLNLLSENFKLARFSGEQFGTRYRRTLMTSNSLFPVAVDEASRIPKKETPEALNILNQAYNANPTRRGKFASLYYICAPVMLLGQDTLPTNDTAFNSKIIKMNIDDSKGVLPAMDKEKLTFPLRNWIEYIINNPLEPEDLERHYKTLVDNVRFNQMDSTTERKLKNYALQLANFELLCDFIGCGQDAFRSFQLSIFQTLAAHYNDQCESSAPDEAIQILKDFANIWAFEKNRYPDLVAYKLFPLKVKDEVTGAEREYEDIGIAVSIPAVLQLLENYKKDYAINNANTFTKRVSKHEDLLYLGNKKTSWSIYLNRTISRRIVLSNYHLKKFGIYMPAPGQEFIDYEWRTMSDCIEERPDYSGENVKNRINRYTESI